MVDYVAKKPVKYRGKVYQPGDRFPATPDARTLIAIGKIGLASDQPKKASTAAKKRSFAAKEEPAQPSGKEEARPDTKVGPTTMAASSADYKTRRLKAKE